MNDREFSSPSAEFSPPEAEFAPPVREWSSPGNEISRVDSAPPRKKRRRIPSMMVAAAAAVTVGLSVISAAPEAVVDNTPRVALTEEQCKYLDEIIEATQNEDIPRMETLAVDPIMRQIMEEVVEPYYDNVLLPYDDSYSDMVQQDDYGYTDYHNFWYDGTTLGPITENAYFGQRLIIDTRFKKNEPMSHWRVSWNVTEMNPRKQEEPYQAYYLLCYGSSEKISSTAFRSSQERIIPADNEFGAKRDITSGTFYDTSYGSTYGYTMIIEGDCITSLFDSNSHSGYTMVVYYQNGTVTLRTGDGRYETTFPIIDGYAKPGGEIEFMMTEGDGHGRTTITDMIWHTPDGEELHMDIPYGYSTPDSYFADLYHVFVMWS